MFDKKIDSDVFRTQQRPLANGELSIKNAIYLIIILSFLALFCALNLNLYAFLLSFIALGLMIIYPLSKRFFPCPQLILGAAFNWGIIMAYAQVQNKIPLEAWVLYIIAMCWTIAYDTIYALSDLFDDMRLNINSSAKLFGQNIIPCIAVFEFIMIIGLIIIGFKHNCSAPYGFILFSCSLLMATQLYFLSKYLKEHKYNKDSCISRITYQKRVEYFINEFKKHHWVGLRIFVAIFVLKFHS